MKKRSLQEAAFFHEYERITSRISFPTFVSLSLCPLHSMRFLMAFRLSDILSPISRPVKTGNGYSREIT